MARSDAPGNCLATGAIGQRQGKVFGFLLSLYVLHS